jgi:glycosyltransferase involved in cell wall biosynthesis
MKENGLSGKHILIIVENLPLPFDRRVWQEANTLAEQGAEVSIICPKMEGYTKSFEEINGIKIYRHPLPVEANGALGYLAEYSISLFWEFVLSWKIFFKKRFHVIHACNPPDLIFLVALFFKPFGVKYVFDHHDLNPELYITKYNKKGFFYKLLLLMEQLTFATADFSIATNESFREIAINRTEMKREKTEVVRSGPDLDRFKITASNDKYKKGRTYFVGYIGVIGEQEGMDLLLESVKYIAQKRQDIQFGIIGFGTELENIKRLASEMNLNDYIDFYGRISELSIILEILNTADVCVNPDKPTEMNNLSTTNKIMEYMALKKPSVQYDLKEGKFTAQESSLYAKNTDTIDFAEKIMWLIDNEKERKKMGEAGYNRMLTQLSWKYESAKLINLYSKVFKS